MCAMRNFVRLLSLMLLLTPLQLSAQTDKRKEEAEDFVQDVLAVIFGPNWNVGLHGGFSGQGRFLLQRTDFGNQERVLKGENGFNIGIGAGVDILLRSGLRINYTYSSSSLAFDTDNGDGSTGLDADDIGDLSSHTVSGEIIRYMLPARSTFTPYGSVGFVATWWMLEEGGFILAPAGSTQLRFGPLASLGLQLKLGSRWNVRLEGTAANTRNPFTGRDSFVAFAGETIDEPSRVTNRDFRLIAMYNFGKQDVRLPSTNGNGKR